MCVIFFFKQKTAYEIVSGDWSSDVCSSDLTCRSTDGQAKLFTGPNHLRTRPTNDGGRETNAEANAAGDIVHDPHSHRATARSTLEATGASVSTFGNDRSRSGDL